MVYLDNAATTFPKPEVVYDAMDSMNRNAVNAGRGSYKRAREESKLIAETKTRIRELVRLDSNVPVVFSPSVTVAINQIVHGLKLRENAVIYVSPYEHNAVARSLYDLKHKFPGIVIKELPLDDDLEIDLEKVKYEFSKDKPDVVFCTHISNVTGYILPIEDIFRESKKNGSINILDSAQSLGLVDIRANQIDADVIAFAGHKTLYGPLGIGGFINVTGIDLDVFIAGGTGSDSLNLEMPEGKESKYESASPNMVAIAGLNAALSWLNTEECFEHERAITKYLIDELSQIDGVKCYLPKNMNNHLGIVSFSIQKYKSEDVGMILDEDYDIEVRTGYHCAPYIHKYLKDEKTLGTVRVGIGRFTTENDINKLVDAIKEIVNE